MLKEIFGLVYLSLHLLLENSLLIQMLIGLGVPIHVGQFLVMPFISVVI